MGAPIVKGLHHVTAISGAPQANLETYARRLGLRFVKKTVNFDDPGVYHLYYGDEVGTPGTAMTFFPWEHMAKGGPGTSETALTHFAVPSGSLAFWQARLSAAGLAVDEPKAVFGEPRLTLRDPDGLGLALVEPEGGDERVPWTTGEVGAEVAIRGFHGVTLTLAEAGPTARLLEEALGYERRGEAGGTLRLVSRHARHAHVVDVVAAPDRPRAQQGIGSVHHIAFAVADGEAQEEVRARIMRTGLAVTPQIDRTYFRSIYFRSPGGVLFEVATEGPGFTVDEPAAELGHNLKLPPQHEHLRAELERRLPPLRL